MTAIRCQCATGHADPAAVTGPDRRRRLIAHHTDHVAGALIGRSENYYLDRDQVLCEVCAAEHHPAGRPLTMDAADQ